MGSNKMHSKFRPSRALEKMILEIAGVDPAEVGVEDVAKREKTSSPGISRKRSRSTSSSTGSSAGPPPSSRPAKRRLPLEERRRPEQDAETLISEARGLKHLADGTEEPAKSKLYIRSGLKFMEVCHVYILESSVEKQVELLQKTAELLEYAAKRSITACHKGLKAHNMGLLKRHAFTAVLALRLAAVTRMARFAVKADKLHKVWDGIQRIQEKIQRADRVRSAGAKVTAGESAAFFVSPEEHSVLTQHSAFVLAEARDSVDAIQMWHEADRLENEISTRAPEVYAETLEAIPDFGALNSYMDLYETVTLARNALRQDSGRSS